MKKNNFLPAIFNRKSDFLTSFDSMFDDMFNNFFTDFGLSNNFALKSGSYPKVNVIDNTNKVIIEAAIPGMAKEDIDLKIKDNILTISGKKQDQIENDPNEKFFIREVKKSAFSRSFDLGDNLNIEDIKAKFNKGMLLITLPKIEPTPEKEKSKTINID